MKRKTAALFALLPLALLAGCAKPMKAPILLTAEPVAIVMATALIAPEMLGGVVTEAVRLSPELAVLIAKTAALAAPDRAAEIRVAVILMVPHEAEAIMAVTKVKRPRTAARIEIPKSEDIEALIARATR